MTLTQSILSFALVAGLMTITPGLDTILVLRSALRDGRRAGALTAIGVGLGVLVWGVAAALGVSALLLASRTAFAALKLAGAAYLLWLGVRFLWRALRPSGSATGHDVEVPQSGVPLAPGWGHVRQGLVTNLLNPKVGAFYIALLPQFLPHDLAPAVGGLILALVHSIEGMAWFAVVILAAHSVRRWLASATAERWIDAVAGVVMAVFGLRLAFGD